MNMQFFWFFMSRFLVGIIIGLLIGSFLFTPAHAGYTGTARYNSTKPKVTNTVNEVTIAIMEYSAAHDIDPLLVAAVIRVESKFDPKAVGSSGEIGLMQLHPRWFADAKFDVRSNISQGVRHLAWSRKHCPHKSGHTWVICFNNGVNRSPKHPTLHPYFKAVTREYEALKANANHKSN